MRKLAALLCVGSLLACEQTGPTPPRPIEPPPGYVAPERPPRPPPPPPPKEVEPAKVAPRGERVRLAWKVAPGEKLALEVRERHLEPAQVSIRLDVAALAAGRAPPKGLSERIISLVAGGETGVLLLLEPAESARLWARAIVTRMEEPKLKGPASKKAQLRKAQKKLAEQVKKLENKVTIEGMMSQSGFVLSDLPRESRNFLALYLELPEREVAVGESWPLSVDLVQLGRDFIPTAEERSNQVTLSALEKQPDGDTVAVLDYLIAERLEGAIHPRKSNPLPASVGMAFVGRGEFLIGRGRWKRLVGRATLEARGPVGASAETEVLVTPAR